MSTEQKTTSLIDEFCDIVLRYYDIPAPMVKAAGYYIISSTLGRHALIADMPGKYTWPNVFFMVGSEPSITHRSTLHSIIEFVLRRNYTMLNPEPVEGEEEKISPVELFYKHNLESSNVEGVADHIRKTAFDYYLIMSSEYGYSLSQASKTNSYTFGIASILAKLYYGESWYQNLSARGGKEGYRYIPEGLYVNMFVSMQNLELYLTDLLLKQGLLRRTVLVPIETTELSADNYKPAMNPDRALVWKYLSEFTDKLSRLEKLMIERSRDYYLNKDGENPKKLVVVPFQNDEVIHVINDYDRMNYTKAIEVAKQNDNGKSSGWNQYAISRWEYLLKFGVLEALAAESPGYEVRMEHLDKGRRFLDLLEPAQRKVITKISLGSGEIPEVQFPTAGYAQRIVLENVAKRAGGYFKQNDVKSILNSTDSKKVAQLIDLLQSNGYMEEILHQGTSREEAQRVLPSEVCQQLIPERGFVPSVYRITEKGRKWISE